MPYYPSEIFTIRETENLPGIVYNPDNKRNIYSEDVQNLGAEITAIETILGTNPQGDYDTLVDRLANVLSLDSGGNLSINSAGSLNLTFDYMNFESQSSIDFASRNGSDISYDADGSLHMRAHGDEATFSNENHENKIVLTSDGSVDIYSTHGAGINMNADGASEFSFNLNDLSFLSIINFAIEATSLDFRSDTLGFFYSSPVERPNSSTSDSAVESGAGIPVTYDDTIGGYRLSQVVQALVDLGLLTGY